MFVGFQYGTLKCRLVLLSLWLIELDFQLANRPTIKSWAALFSVSNLRSPLISTFCLTRRSATLSSTLATWTFLCHWSSCSTVSINFLLNYGRGCSYPESSRNQVVRQTSWSVLRHVSVIWELLGNCRILSLIFWF
jgi:hypothetical protein